MSSELKGVGKTALGVALVRAEESRRSVGLFDDPYAQAFVDAAPDELHQRIDDARAGAAELSGVKRLLKLQ